MEQLWKILVIFGIILVVAGGLVYLASRLNLPLGRLPGDIRIETGPVTCLVPIATSIILSIVLTILLNVVARFLNK